MQQFLEKIVKTIVSNPEAVEITEEIQDNWHHLKLNVAEEDMGLIIGKSGKSISALRALLRIKAIKEGKQIYLELMEPEGQDTQNTEVPQN